MILYGKEEMDALIGKDSVMAKLIAHYGHFEPKRYQKSVLSGIAKSIRRIVLWHRCTTTR